MRHEKRKDIMKKKLMIMLLALSAALSAGACGQAADSAGTRAQQEQTADAAKAGTGEEADGELTVKNAMFAITLPEDAAGKFEAKTTDTSISVFDKEAADAGFGGFAFGVSLYHDPSEYAGGMDLKVGEFTAADGKLYDVAMSYPSDVQYDYTVHEDKMPDSYALLYNGAEEIVEKTFAGADGGTFVFGGGTKGEELYGEILEKHRRAVEEDYDASRLEEEDMSPMYYNLNPVRANASDTNLIGYAYYDANYDGVDELFIGEISDDENWKGTVYDIYTMVDRKPAHVVSGSARDRYYALENGMICNEYSGGAGQGGWIIYDIEPNGTDLNMQLHLKYDEYENPDEPWMISYGEDTWESLTEKEFNQRLSNFPYERFDFTPLMEQ